MAALKALGGTSDTFPEEASRWQRLEASAREILALYGYQEVRTPLLEEAAVFTQSLGQSDEIVTKQMYLLKDRGGRELALRPEGTAPVVRAFVERGLDKTGGLTRLYYLGPMFRAERPQAGRKRQFHQLGVEVFGTASPYQDAEVLLLLTRLLCEWRMKDWTLKINSIGCQGDRARILSDLKSRLTPHRQKLCRDCQVRLEKNPLRILDCKKADCQKATDGVDFSKAVCEACAAQFIQLTESLSLLQVKFVRDPHLVRGLDYYTRTTFEVEHPALGVQNAIGGGGRYDDLVARMGGQPVPAIGFALGLERVLMAQEKEVPNDSPDLMGAKVFVATVDFNDVPLAMVLAEGVRRHGISCVANLDDRPLKRQLEQAQKWRCQVVAIQGESERLKGVVALKQMASRTQIEVPEGHWFSKLQELLKS